MEEANDIENDLGSLEAARNMFLLVLSLVCMFGLIMVLSASFGYSRDIYGTSYYYFVRQLIFMLLGLGLAFTVSRLKIKVWFEYAEVLNWLAIGALILTFFPYIGVKVKGSHRWLNLGLKLQPGEFVKYSLIIPSIYFFNRFDKMTLQTKLKKGFALLLPLLILLLQPDFGTFAICSMIIFFTALLSPLPRKIFYWSFGTMGVFSLLALIAAPYRVRRLFAFLDPWKNPQGDSFQLIQSLQAFAGGGFFGKGLGNSMEKLHYLPEAHNDFIFSIVGEELGFVGVVLVILLFLTLLFFGFRLAIKARERTSCIVIASVVFLIGVQAFFNMAVVMGLLPTKGLNFPFVSYGGSSLLANFMGIGLILSTIKHERLMVSVHSSKHPHKY